MKIRIITIDFWNILFEFDKNPLDKRNNNNTIYLGADQ